MASLTTPVRFAAVGLATAAMYSALFVGLCFVGLWTPVANVAAYALAIVFQFVGHHSFTFRVGGPLTPIVVRFLTANAVGLVTSTVLSVALRDGLGSGALLTGVVVSLSLAVMNWFVMRQWVFRR